MNRLAEIGAALDRAEGRETHVAAAGALWAQWCALNSVTMRREIFALTHLATATPPARGDALWAVEDWPGNDHTRWFWAGDRPALIVSEPYDADLPALRTYVRAFGLELHTPPNPLASFHYPGRTAFAAIARLRGAVRWLEAQVMHVCSVPSGIDP